MEGLSEFEWLLNISVDDEIATHKRDDAIVESWLSIEGNNLVLDAWHSGEFCHDVLHA